MPSNRNISVFVQYVLELLHHMKMMVMNNEVAEQIDSHAENSPGQQIRIEMPELDSQSQLQTQGNGTATEITEQQQQQQQPVVDVEASAANPSQSRTEEADIETGLSIAISVTLTVAGGVIAVLAGFIGNKTTSTTHKLFFKASMISMCTAYVFGCFILLLATFRPSIPCLSAVVKILLLAAIGSLALVVGFGVTFYFRRDR